MEELMRPPRILWKSKILNYWRYVAQMRDSSCLCIVVDVEKARKSKESIERKMIQEIHALMVKTIKRQDNINKSLSNRFETIKTIYYGAKVR